MDLLREEIERVDIPGHDPVYGLDGPLVNIWKQASLQMQGRMDKQPADWK